MLIIIYTSQCFHVTYYHYKWYYTPFRIESIFNLSKTIKTICFYKTFLRKPILLHKTQNTPYPTNINLCPKSIGMLHIATRRELIDETNFNGITRRTKFSIHCKVRFSKLSCVHTVIIVHECICRDSSLSQLFYVRLIGRDSHSRTLCTFQAEPRCSKTNNIWTSWSRTREGYGMQDSDTSPRLNRGD